MVGSLPAAAVGGRTAIGVDDDLAARHACVAVGTADLEAARRVDVVDGLVAEKACRHHAGDDVLHVSVKLGLLLALVIAGLVLGRDDDRGRLGRLSFLEAKGDLALRVRLQERRCAAVAVLGHLGEDLVAVVERRGHEVRSLVAGEAEHDALVASALVLVLTGIDALRDMRRLRVEVIGEVEAVPVEAVLLVADALHDAPHGLLDLLADAGRPIAGFVHDALAADLAGKDDAIGGGHRLAGDARLGVLGQEQVHDRVGNLVCDLVGMAFGNGFGGEQVRAAHMRGRVLWI